MFTLFFVELNNFKQNILSFTKYNKKESSNIVILTGGTNRIKNGLKIIAYDICPVNVVLNYFSKKIGFGFDKDGNLAKSGSINKKLLDELNQIECYNEEPPKSLGIEWVKENIFPIIEKYKITNEDILCTYTEHICCQIVKNIDAREAYFGDSFQLK